MSTSGGRLWPQLTSRRQIRHLHLLYFMVFQHVWPGWPWTDRTDSRMRRVPLCAPVREAAQALTGPATRHPPLLCTPHPPRLPFLLSHLGPGTQQLGCPVAQRSPRQFKPTNFLLSNALFMACSAHTEGPGSVCDSFLHKLIQLVYMLCVGVCVPVCSWRPGGNIGVLLYHPLL